MPSDPNRGAVLGCVQVRRPTRQSGVEALPPQLAVISEMAWPWPRTSCRAHGAWSVGMLYTMQGARSVPNWSWQPTHDAKLHQQRCKLSGLLAVRENATRFMVHCLASGPSVLLRWSRLRCQYGQWRSQKNDLWCSLSTDAIVKVPHPKG
jgi:hypothetical protein